jgi:hypothetical protein
MQWFSGNQKSDRQIQRVLTRVLEVLAPLLLLVVLLFGGAEEGVESAFLPASNTISMTRLLASRFVAEIARVYISRVIRELA